MKAAGRHATIWVWPTLAAAAVSVTGCGQPLHPVRLSWQNEAFCAVWNPDSTSLEITHRTARTAVCVPVGIESLDLDVGRVSELRASYAAPVVRRRPGGQTWTFTHPPVTLPGTPAVLRCTVEFEFEQARPWFRKRGLIENVAREGNPLLTRVVLAAIDLRGRSPRQPFDGWQSYPVLADTFFAGIEFPAANAQLENDVAGFSCKPGRQLAPRDRYECKPLVFGVCPAGESRKAFEAYIASLRPASPPIHIQYNSWWSAPFPFTEKHMLDIAQVFQEQFHDPFGGQLDSFCLDMGWAKSQSLWKIDAANFPHGLKPLADSLARMHAGVALWTSPSSYYPRPGSLDSEWAKANGYETFKINPPDKTRYACLAGPKYANGFKDALVELTRQYHIAHFKFDGYIPMCPESDHGHQPGELSAERVADGFIAACKALRSANPDIWLEATCFGYRPSPWWLPYINTVIGTHGNDAPRGRVPCPVYRESYTTARDFYNLQGARDVLIPIYAQEVLGIVHQTSDPLQNDAVVAVLRGHSFIPMYINPRYMDSRRWRFLADLCSWARKNADLLSHTKALPLGDWGSDEKGRSWDKDLPRDPYGYAHFDGGRGLLMLRNPWIQPRHVELTLDGSIGTEADLSNASVVCLYPRFGKWPGVFSYGQRIAVDLAPYETRLLAVGGNDDAPPLGSSPSAIPPTKVNIQVSEPDGRLVIDGEVPSGPPGRQLWLLAESREAFQMPDCQILVNGQRVESQISESDTGWRSSTAGREHWYWQLAELPAGEAKLQAILLAQDTTQLSAWLVSKEAVPDDRSSSGPIPPPETRFLDARELVSPVTIKYPEPVQTVNVALTSEGAIATASSAWSDELSPGKSIDGKRATRWNSARGDVAGAWLAVDFGQRRKISSIRFLEAANGRITRYRLQTWNDTGWTDLLVSTKPASKANVRHRFPAIETSKLRLLVEAATDIPTIYEFEAR